MGDKLRVKLPGIHRAIAEEYGHLRGEADVCPATHHNVGDLPRVPAFLVILPGIQRAIVE